ncbi:transposable element Tcb2 transposase [Trichonephila clavipes]|nr:transposable element Tcb2 transposase [Trichonephila clavipes]
MDKSSSSIRSHQNERKFYIRNDNFDSFPRARHHSKRRRRWVRVKRSTCTGRRDPKCPSARRLRMVREDTVYPSEGANCAWMAVDEAVGCAHEFLTICWTSRRLVCRRCPEPAEVAKAIGVSQNVISRIWNRFLETGTAGRRPGQGRRLAATPNEDRYLVLTARRHRNMNATLLQQHLCSATGTTVSIQTIKNRLHGVGLYARWPMVSVRLTSRYRRDRREWPTEDVNWRKNESSNVLFSDESSFSVHPDNRRIFMWRDRGSRNNPAFAHESIRFGGGGVLVYGGISIDERTDPHIIRDGPLTAR